MKKLLLFSCLALLAASCKMPMLSDKPVGDNCVRVSVRVTYEPSPYVAFDTTVTQYVCDTNWSVDKIMKRLGQPLNSKHLH